jgi:hypothetical protein
MVRDVIVPIANVSASSNRVYAMCPTVTTVRDVRVSIVDVGASSNRVCATCLLGHHSSDRTAAVGHLPVVTVVVDRWYRDVL